MTLVAPLAQSAESPQRNQNLRFATENGHRRPPTRAKAWKRANQPVYTAQVVHCAASAAWDKHTGLADGGAGTWTTAIAMCGAVKPENRTAERLFLSLDEPPDCLLLQYEEIWVTLYPFLLSRGYRLRPRYHPEWIPSWAGSSDPLTAFECEDAIQGRPNAVDAISTNGSKVMLKRIDLETEELDIALYVSRKSRADDPRNYCVPILDVILIPACETHAIIVMPLLYEHAFLPFRHIGELLEIGFQLSKCLEFLHEHNIAHRDFCHYNIMVDPTRILPQGFHPWEPGAPLDGTRDKHNRFKWKSRWSVRPNRYYVIDFGMSRRYDKREGILELGVLGQDRTVPEMSDTVPYDPFPMDVYQFGNMLLRIYKDYSPTKTLGVLTSLAQRMTNTDPSLRPTASEIALEYDRLSQKIGYFELRERIWPSRPPYSFAKKLRIAIGFSVYPD